MTEERNDQVTFRDKINFQTFLKALAQNRVALTRAKNPDTGDTVTFICILNPGDGPNSFQPVPFLPIPQSDPRAEYAPFMENGKYVEGSIVHMNEIPPFTIAGDTASTN